MIIVLGHSGFIGKAVLAALRLSRGAPEERGGILGLSSSELNLLDREAPTKITALSADQPIFIFCPAIIPSQGGDTLESFRKNTEMVFNFSRGLRPGVKKVVFLSSNAVYGDHHFSGLITETTPIMPHSFYVAAKLAGEAMLERVCADLGIPLLILRLTIVYGPGDKPRYNPSFFVTSALKEKKIEIFGDGEDKRDFLFVEDAGRIISHLAQSEAVGIYNVASGQSYSFREAAEMIKSFLPETEIISKPRRQPISSHQFDISKLKTALAPDFCFTYLEQGIAACS